MPVSQRFLCALLMALLSGCGGGAPDDAPVTAPVRGKVTRKGMPLAGVSVIFQPQGIPEGQPGSPSSAVTNDAGEYELAYTANVAGAIPGSHRVALSLGDGLDDDDPSKKAPMEVVIPVAVGVRDVTVPPEGLNGGAADFDLDF